MDGVKLDKMLTCLIPGDKIAARARLRDINKTDRVRSVFSTKNGLPEAASVIETRDLPVGGARARLPRATPPPPALGATDPRMRETPRAGLGRTGVSTQLRFFSRDGLKKLGRAHYCLATTHPMTICGDTCVRARWNGGRGCRCGACVDGKGWFTRGGGGLSWRLRNRSRNTTFGWDGEILG